MVKSAERVMRILETVCYNKDGLTQKDISEHLQIPKSSLSAILTNMTDREYLVQDQLTKRFVLGPQLLILAGGYLNNQDVVGQGRPLVSKLSRETGESGALAIPVGWDALLVYKEDCLQPILPSIQIGTRFPFFASAVGKAILAHYSDREIRQYLSSVELAAITKHTVTDPEQLLSELKAIRNGALAYNREGYREGITAIAAPVFNHNGRVVASISISALTLRLTPKKEKLFEGIITKITNRFSRLLGYSPR
jgi:DNA-binding IclR family transcriptional regulator